MDKSIPKKWTRFLTLFAPILNADNDGAHPQASGYNKMADLIQQSGQWWFS